VVLVIGLAGANVVLGIDAVVAPALDAAFSRVDVKTRALDNLSPAISATAGRQLDFDGRTWGANVPRAVGFHANHLARDLTAERVKECK
jgi:hypothetical protein